MTLFYWLVNSDRLRLESFLENTNDKDQFFGYRHIDSRKVTS